MVSQLTNNNSKVIDFAWAPNSSRIAYIADQDTIDVFELYTNTSVGNSPRKVSDALEGGEDVKDFAWSPDSLLIAYSANQDEINKDELYTTSPDINFDFTKVSGTPTAGGLDSVFPLFAWSPNSDLIAYIAEQSPALSSELYTSNSDGTINDNVAPVPLPSGGSVVSFEWEPNSTRVAYLAPQDTINVNELYSSKPDGMDNIKISGELVTGGNVLDNYEWAP
jgi:Tol biopolymer transport system component